MHRLSSVTRDSPHNTDINQSYRHCASVWKRREREDLRKVVQQNEEARLCDTDEVLCGASIKRSPPPYILAG